MANNIKINNPLGKKPEQQQKGSGFLNIGKVIQANTGNRLGQTVAQGVTQGAQQVQQGIGQLAGQFGQEAEAKNLASIANKQAVSDALSKIAGGQSDVTPEQIKQFGTFRAGQYAGPTELDPTKTVQLGAKAQETQEFGKALGSQGDKSKLLQATVGQGPYSAGQVKLDTLLLGKGPQAKEQLAQARQQTKGLSQQLTKEQNVAQQIAQLKANQSKQFGQETGQQIAGQETGINTDLANALTGAQTDAEARYNQYLQGLASRRLGASPELQAQLAGTQLFRTSPNQALDLSGLVERGMAPTQQNIASLSQRGQLEALSKLGGKDPSALGFAQDVYDPSKAVGFNKTRLDQMVGAGKQAYEQRLGEIVYSPTGGTPAQTGNPEIDALSAKMANVGLTIPEKIRMTELAVEQYRNPQTGQLPGWAQNQLAESKNLLETVKQQQGYYDVIS